MPIQVLMPQFGESVVEGTLTQWLKAVGERVEQYEPLVEVNTDKVDTELPSPVSGVLEQILVEAGVTVHAGTLLAVIREAEDVQIHQEGSPGEQPKKVEKPAAQLSTHSSRNGNNSTPITAAPIPTGRHPELGFISPLVARLAQEHAVDLRLVTGTGMDGRITKQDVLRYLKEPTASQPGEALPTASGERARPVSTPTVIQLPGDEVVPLNTLRRKIAEHMVFSERTSPHVTTVMEADLSQVVAHRQTHKVEFLGDGINLTFTAYFVAAAAAALRTYPIVNASWSDQGILLHRQINIGMATALDEGLIVPVIQHADDLSLKGVARAVNNLAVRARAHKLLPEEVYGGTFTITNHGISGSLFATPIINQPQCAILGTGTIQKRVVVLETEQGDSIAIRPMAYLSLTFDHRILDGALADHFLGKVVELLQNWKD